MSAACQFTLRRSLCGIPGILCGAVLLAVLGTSAVRAEVTPEQSRQLRELKGELAAYTALVRKKDFAAAEQLLKQCEQSLQDIIAAAGVKETDRRLQGVPQLIQSRRQALARLTGKGSSAGASSGVSFSTDVAPIIRDACLGCHGADNPRAGLRLDTFAGWKRGGQNGALVNPGNPTTSLLMGRLMAADATRRMPRDDDPLARESLETIAVWIRQGARFDGDADTTTLSRLARGKLSVVIPRPQGSETVSFQRDIAPFMVQLCVGCHSGATPRGGLSLVTFEDLMIGGDSGEVVIPGDRENSRLFRLVGGLENPRMPQGDGRITRKNYEDLIRWFDEGNVFDGPDPRAALASYVPTAEQLAAARFAAMTAEQQAAHRRDRAETLWRQTLPNDPHDTLETDEFLLLGDVGPQRLQEVADCAGEHLKVLRRTFGGTEEPAWKGKLAILVFSEPFALAEYCLTRLGLDNSDGIFGHAFVSATLEDAFVVLLDAGDPSTGERPGLKANVTDHLTGAYLLRGGPLPEWLVRGLGLRMAAQTDPASPYIKALPGRGATALATIRRPAELFDDGTFAPAFAGPVGYLLVQFLADRGGSERLAECVRQLQQGTPVDAVFQSAFLADRDALGQSFLRAVSRGR
jgi:hypothetical protein